MDKTTTQTSGLPTWTNNYPCLSDIGTLKKTTLDGQVLDSQVIYQYEEGDNIYFNKDFTYTYKYKNGNRDFGKWSCKSNGLYLDDNDVNGKTWTKDTGWVEKTTTNTGGSTNSGSTITRRSHTLTGYYTVCPETLPILKGCKNQTIKKLQNCIGNVVPDGKFGPLTQARLEELDLPGTRITTDSLVRACSPITSTNSSSTTQPPNTQSTIDNSKTPGTVEYYDDYRSVEGDENESSTNYYDDYNKSVEGEEENNNISQQKPLNKTPIGYNGYFDSTQKGPLKK